MLLSFWATPQNYAFDFSQFQDHQHLGSCDALKWKLKLHNCRKWSAFSGQNGKLLFLEAMQISFRSKNTSTNDFFRYALFLRKINHSSILFAQFAHWNSLYNIFGDFFFPRQVKHCTRAVTLNDSHGSADWLCILISVLLNLPIKW